jgi:hypothetical protein
MGYDTKKQKYLQMPVILKQLELIKRDAEFADVEESRALNKFGALIAILTAGSLRGHEGLYVDLSATRKYLGKGKNGVLPANALKRGLLLTEQECSNLPEVCLCLIGKFKGETGERHHSIVLANESSSGLQTRWWIEKLLEVCEAEGRTTGYAFYYAQGRPPVVSDYNALVRQYLEKIQEESPELFGPEEDLSRYGISRTYRKSSETRARRAGMKTEDVKVMNRWGTIEKAGCRRPRHAMVDHYADARGLTSLTWKYSYAL